MPDPALRCAPYIGTDKECSHATRRRAYRQSSVLLPKVWSRKTLRPPGYLSLNTSNAMLYSVRDRTPYFPFCKELYDIATSPDTACDWQHIVLDRNAQSEYSYNFPCGCQNPDLVSREHLSVHTSEDTNAYMQNESGDSQLYRVPNCPTFSSRAPRKRRRKSLSLTDSKTYRRLLRSKHAAPSQYLSQLLNDDDTQSDDTDT
jgi:hypothetical protein